MKPNYLPYVKRDLKELALKRANLRLTFSDYLKQILKYDEKESLKNCETLEIGIPEYILRDSSGDFYVSVQNGGLYALDSLCDSDIESIALFIVGYEI